MAMEWYVIHAYSGYENKVREALLERIERFSMEENFGEIMVPSEEVVELRGGQERRIQRKFFPGYVLVKMELNDSTWHLVKDTPRVMGFIGGSKDKPTPISETEAKGIMQQLEHGAEIALSYQGEAIKKRVLPLSEELNSALAVTAYLRPALFVPETKSVSETFNVMREGGHSMVLTVDEFGGIAGLATLKQMMAVIVGQMGEEGVAPEESVTALGRDAFRMDAGLAISDINEELELEIPDGDYQTLAGFILDRLGRIPEVGDVMEFENLRITIKAMERVKIEEVELRRLSSGNEADTGSGSAINGSVT